MEKPQTKQTGSRRVGYGRLWLFRGGLGVQSFWTQDKSIAIFASFFWRSSIVILSYVLSHFFWPRIASSFFVIWATCTSNARTSTKMHTITNIEATLMIIPPFVRNVSLVLTPSDILMQKAKNAWYEKQFLCHTTWFRVAPWFWATSHPVVY